MICDVTTDYQVLHACPTADEYMMMRKMTGLSERSPEAAERGLNGSLFAVSIRSHDQIVGMGRIIGDGGSFYNIVDIAVLPAHQKRGLGKVIMMNLMNWLKENATATAGVSLLADGEAYKLYQQFGFKLSAPASVGMTLRLI